MFYLKINFRNNNIINNNNLTCFNTILTKSHVKENFQKKNKYQLSLCIIKSFSTNIIKFSLKTRLPWGAKKKLKKIKPNTEELLKKGVIKTLAKVIHENNNNNKFFEKKEEGKIFYFYYSLFFYI